MLSPLKARSVLDSMSLDSFCMIYASAGRARQFESKYGAFIWSMGKENMWACSPCGLASLIIIYFGIVSLAKQWGSFSNEVSNDLSGHNYRTCIEKIPFWLDTVAILLKDSETIPASYHCKVAFKKHLHFTKDMCNMLMYGDPWLYAFSRLALSQGPCH